MYIFCKQLVRWSAKSSMLLTQGVTMTGVNRGFRISEGEWQVCRLRCRHENLSLMEHNIIRFVVYCRFYFPFFSISQKFELAGIELHIVCICPFAYSLCISFWPSMRPLRLLFLVVFEYHQQSIILLCRWFRYLYQIYVIGIGWALTLTLGVRHF